MPTVISPKLGKGSADAIDSFLLDLHKVFKASSLYPSNHPSLLSLFKKPFKEISAILDETEQVGIRYKKGVGFFWDEIPVARQTPSVRELGERLFQLRIQSIYFLRGLTLIELQAMLAVINSEPGGVDSADRCDDLLREKGVRYIWFNKIDYGKILEAQQNINEKAEEIEVDVYGEGTGTAGGIYDFLDDNSKVSGPDALETESSPTGTPLSAQSAPLGESVTSTEKDTSNNIDELIDKWRGSKSFLEFEENGNILINRFNEAGSQGDIFIITKIFDAYLDAHEQLKEEEFVEFISNSLNRMVEAKEPLELLLNLACDKNNKDAASTETIIRLKGRAASRTADRLALEGDVGARKILNSILVRMGKEIIPQLIDRLTDERWYVVRNTVRILGEIGESRGVEDALRSPLVHKDPRVRKETVRALSMIKGPETVNLMRSVLDDIDSSVVEMAEVSLGLLIDAGSVPELIELVENRVDSGVRKEAVRALGRIGGRKAVSYLSGILEKRGWMLGSRDDELKVMCVSALADIGTPDAIKALEAGLSSSREVVSNACEAALRRIKHG